jgi:hypothetical protein
LGFQIGLAGGLYTSSLTVDGYYFSSSATSSSALTRCGSVGDAVLCTTNAQINLTNSRFTNSRTGSTLPNIVSVGLSSANPARGLTSRGNYYQNASGYAPLNNESGVLLGSGGFIASNTYSGIAVESFGDQGGVIGTSRVPLTNYYPPQLVPPTVTTSSPVTLTTPLTLNQDPTAAAAVTYELPVAASALGQPPYCVSNSYNGSAATTGQISVGNGPDASIIFYDGTLEAPSGSVYSAGAAGDYGCFVAVDSTHWQMLGVFRGTWTKH